MKNLENCPVAAFYETKGNRKSGELSVVAALYKTKESDHKRVQ
nr:hypothetical protein [Lysinibacillus timonensis]